MASQRPSRKSKDAAIAGLQNLTRRQTRGQAAEEVEQDETVVERLVYKRHFIE